MTVMKKFAIYFRLFGSVDVGRERRENQSGAKCRCRTAAFTLAFRCAAKPPLRRDLEKASQKQRRSLIMIHDVRAKPNSTTLLCFFLQEDFFYGDVDNDGDHGDPNKFGKKIEIMRLLLLFSDFFRSRQDESTFVFVGSASCKEKFLHLSGRKTSVKQTQLFLFPGRKNVFKVDGLVPNIWISTNDRFRSFCQQTAKSVWLVFKCLFLERALKIPPKEKKKMRSKKSNLWICIFVSS